MLSEGNVPESVTPDKKPTLGDEPDDYSQIPNSNPSFFDEPQAFLTKYRKEIFFIIVALGLTTFVYLQRDSEDEETKEDKKFIRQMKIFKDYER